MYEGRNPGVEKVDTNVGTKKFGPPGAGAVAVAGGRDESPMPEAAKDKAWESS